jgi:UDP-3-O-[3-hydroxymyristoyl] glucosamine N-acyltransferase
MHQPGSKSPCSKPISLQELADWTQSEYSNSEKMIFSLARDFASATPDQVTFLGDDIAKPRGDTPPTLHTHAGACFVKAQDVQWLPAHTLPLITPRPYRAFIQALRRIEDQHNTRESTQPRISPMAHIDPSATIDATCTIAAGVMIGPRAHIMAHTFIGAYSIIESDVVIGAHSQIDAHVSIESAIIGEHTHIQSGGRIGQIGFGFVIDDLGFLEIPHQGKVIIGDYVHIGANTTISRGSFQNTIIGSHTRIDALVQIAHNVQVGQYVVMASQCGIAGSCIIGDRCILGGQVGLANGVVLAPGTRIAAKSGVMHSTQKAETLAGIPAVSAQQWRRQIIMLAKSVRFKPQSKP